MGKKKQGRNRGSEAGFDLKRRQTWPNTVAVFCPLPLRFSFLSFRLIVQATFSSGNSRHPSFDTTVITYIRTMKIAETLFATALGLASISGVDAFFRMPCSQPVVVERADPYVVH